MRCSQNHASNLVSSMPRQRSTAASGPCPDPHRPGVGAPPRADLFPQSLFLRPLRCPKQGFKRRLFCSDVPFESARGIVGNWCGPLKPAPPLPGGIDRSYATEERTGDHTTSKKPRKTPWTGMPADDPFGWSRSGLFSGLSRFAESDSVCRYASKPIRPVLASMP
jgi:hypothetical protein